MRKPGPRNDETGLGSNPLADEPDPLATHFYRDAVRPAAPPPAEPERRSRKGARGGGRQPLADGRSFRLVTFSFYEEDVARLDALLERARIAGHRRVSRSQIVRLALRQVNLSELPPEV
jgi:hypothetical protein